MIDPSPKSFSFEAFPFFGRVDPASIYMDPDGIESDYEPFVPVGCDVVGRAGCGSFSDVWKIRDLNTGRFYALKQMRPEWCDKPVARKVMSIEAVVGSRAGGAHVVRVLDDDPDGESPFLIMEWLEGETLESLLQRERNLSESQAVWIARQCVQGLQELEQAGYAHGDIKPDNIFVTDDGNIKLIDLGFSRSLESDADEFSGKLLTGTAEYMAPEMCSSARYDPIAKDLYGLGITLFRMLTGRLPFTARTTADVLTLQKESRAPKLRRWCPLASREVAELVNRLLAKQPIRRPRQLSGLVRELIQIELMTLPERFAG